MKKCVLWHDWYPSWWRFVPGFILPIKRWLCKNCSAEAFTWLNEVYPKKQPWLGRFVDRMIGVSNENSYI